MARQFPDHCMIACTNAAHRKRQKKVWVTMLQALVQATQGIYGKLVKHTKVLPCHMVVMESCFVSPSAVVNVQAKQRRMLPLSSLTWLCCMLVIEPALHIMYFLD